MFKLFISIQSPKSKMLFNCGIEHSPSRFNCFFLSGCIPALKASQGSAGALDMVDVGDILDQVVGINLLGIVVIVVLLI